MAVMPNLKISLADAYVVRLFSPDDAQAITSCIRSVYGNHYLSQAVYDPDHFVRANASGDTVSFVAQHAGGEVVAHLALIKSAPNPALVEVAQGVVVKDHRQAGLLSRLIEATMDYAKDVLHAQGVFGNALCNHVISQRSLVHHGFVDTGFEIDYVPARMLAQEKSCQGAAATVSQFHMLQNSPDLVLHSPPAYRPLLEEVLGHLGDRRILPDSGAERLPQAASCAQLVDLPRFDMTRMTLLAAGGDLRERLVAMEREAAARRRNMLQVVVNLGAPEAPLAIDLLHEAGYWLGGFLPRWLGSDGLLLQKCLGRPNFAEIKVFSPVGLRLLREVKESWMHAEGAFEAAA